MSYSEHDAEMDEFYDQISEELYPEHREQAIDEFTEKCMHSYYLKHPNIIQAPFESYSHANELIEVSPRCALVMYTISIELFLKLVLLKPVLYGMIHNENIANMIVDSSIGQTGVSRYYKLLNSLCFHAANIKLSDIKGMDGRQILVEAEEVQKIRNRVVHQGYVATIEDMGKAKNIATLVLTEVIEPVLKNMNLLITHHSGEYCVVKA